jgi:hypothetical protein
MLMVAQTEVRKAATAAALGLLCLLVIGTAMAANSGEVKTSAGLTVYLGVVPAEIVKGPTPHSAERPMHGRVPRGPHEYHVVAAIFDAATGTRVSDASVSAQLSGVGLSGERKNLEPMQISGTTTYGAFFSLPGRDLYTIRLAIVRPGARQPVTIDFRYDHRR